MPREKTRCGWAGSDPLYVDYHDLEWGVPEYADGRLFEMLLLEGAQAGLAWITILRKREGYREAFAGFDPEQVAAFDRRKVARLLKDEGIVRNRLKVESAIKNAKVFLRLKEQHGTFARYLWRFVEGRPIVNEWKTQAEVPAETDESKAMSRELKREGMNFVGPTICYAYMQSIGMVNDHVTDCFRYKEIQGPRRRR